MMKSLAVISDTHGTLTQEKLEGLFPPESGIITLGDITNQELKIIKDTYQFLGGVKGNCDKDGHLPVTDTIEIGGIRIFLTHSPFNITIQSTSPLYPFCQESNQSSLSAPSSQFVSILPFDPLSALFLLVWHT